MTQFQAPRKSAPSPWAVGLLVLSTGFALFAIVLAATGYAPL
jgi:hypothetical protein